MKTLLVRLAALGISLGLTLCVVEVALRTLVPGQKHWFVMPPRASLVLHPDPAIMPGMSAEVRFSTNAMGLRGPLPPGERGAASAYRVVAIGGSTTECMYTGDDRTWTAQAHRALAAPAADGRPRWLAAAGKSGAYSRDHVLHLTHLLEELPGLEAAVVLVGVNDLTVALSAGDGYRRPPPLSDPAALRAQIRRAFAVAPGRLHESVTEDQLSEGAAFYKRTALFQLARRVRAGLVGSKLDQDDRGTTLERWRENRRSTPVPLRATLPDLREALAEYRANLEAMADIAARNRVKLMFLTQPTLWRADLPPEAEKLLWLGGVGMFQEQPGATYFTPAALAQAMAKWNQVTLEVCKARALDCLDLAERVPRTTEYFYDDCHYTDAGQDVIGREVGAWLAGVVR